MNDAELMSAISAQWDSLIRRVVSRSSLPAPFLAALVANESGGDPQASRYEPKVFQRLKLKYPDWQEPRLTDNATSWGLTQIMGINYSGAPRDLIDPETNLAHAVWMLSQFAERFQLDLKSEFSALFHCWNTGQPDKPTFDPDYAAKGLARMALYKNLNATSYALG